MGGVLPRAAHGEAVGFQPHAFVVGTDTVAHRGPRVADLMKDIADEAQEQMAAFFNSNGESTIDADGAGSLFESRGATIPTDFGFTIPP